MYIPRYPNVCHNHTDIQPIICLSGIIYLYYRSIGYNSAKCILLGDNNVPTMACGLRWTMKLFLTLVKWDQIRF